MKKKSIFKPKRLFFYNISFLIIVFYVVYCYVKISVFNNEKLRQEALMQWTKSYQSQSQRGEILDSSGIKLAVNIPAFTIWINPKSYADNKDKDQFKKDVMSFSSLSEDDLNEILNGSRRKKIIQWADESTVEFIAGMKNPQGLEVEEKYRRYYPEGILYNHILGFTDIDSNGLSGLEYIYNKELFGDPTRTVKMTDAKNRELPFSHSITYGELNHGDLVLTIDERIQKIAQEEALQTKKDHNAVSCSILIMDPMTGDILAMADTNLFNNNNPRAPIDEEQKERWSELSQEELVNEWSKNWENLNVNRLYEPGSTFKSVTLAAALEEGAVDDSTALYCNGAVTDIPGVVLKCVRWQNPHGRLNITESYSESCNVAFIQIGRKLGKEKFYKYVKAFGFGEKSGIDLNGEEQGLIPNNLAEMTPVRLATVTYGQGIATTNVQMALATAAIVNGGELLKPRLVKQIVKEDKILKQFPVEVRRKVISKATSEKMKNIMEYSVQNGNKRAKVEGYRVGGKSGTAFKAENGKYLQNKYVSSFIGVAPIDDPKILVLVLVDEPSKGITFGGAVAGPVSSRIMSKVLPILNIKSSQEVQKNDNKIVAMPNLVGLTLEDATKLLNENNINFYIDKDKVNSTDIVVSTKPEAGVNFYSNEIVDLKLKEGKKVKVPDFKNLTKDQATKIADELKLKLNIVGEGLVTSQSIEKDVEVYEYSVVTINLEKKDN